MTHDDAREGKWRGNWRMEWVASTLKRPRNVVYPTLLKLMRTPRLPAVDWTESPADLNGLVRLGERRNQVSARVPLGSARALLGWLHVNIASIHSRGRYLSFPLSCPRRLWGPPVGTVAHFPWAEGPEREADPSFYLLPSLANSVLTVWCTGN